LINVLGLTRSRLHVLVPDIVRERDHACKTDTGNGRLAVKIVAQVAVELHQSVTP